MDPRTINFTWNVELVEDYDKYLCATMADVWDHCCYLMDTMLQPTTSQNSWQSQLLSDHSWHHLMHLHYLPGSVGHLLITERILHVWHLLAYRSQITSVSPKGFLTIEFILLKNHTQYLWPHKHSRNWTTRIPREAQTSYDVSSDFDLVERQPQTIWVTFKRAKNAWSTNPQVSSSRN